MTLDPQTIAAERAVIGAALLWPDRVREATVLPADFLVPSLGAAWRAILDLQREGVRPDALTVADRSPAAKLDELLELTSSVAVGNIAHHARLVREAAITREVRSAADSILHSEARGVELVAEATAALGRIALPQACSGETLRDGIGRTLDEIGQALEGKLVAGLRTGLSDLDEACRGIPFQVVTLLAGRPSAGKSALALQIAASVAESGEPADYWSLEDSRAGIHRRLLASRAQVGLEKLIFGGLTPAEYGRVSQAAGELHRWGCRLFISDDMPRDPEQFALEVERTAIRRGSKLIVIDFVQLLSHPSLNARSRNDELTAISGRLKAIPKTTGAALLLLSQLTREAEREDRPHLWHLRDCGSLEQDAHQVWLLHRADWLRDGEGRRLPVVAAYIDKNKDAGPAKCVLHFHGPTVRFGDLSGDMREEVNCAVARRKAQAKTRTKGSK